MDELLLVCGNFSPLETKTLLLEGQPVRPYCLKSTASQWAGLILEIITSIVDVPARCNAVATLPGTTRAGGAGTLTIQNMRSTMVVIIRKDATIPVLTDRDLYEESLHQLSELVAKRSAHLRALDVMTRLAMEMTPASGMIIEFDISRAEEQLAAVERLTAEISSAIQRVNRFAERCGAPSVKWQNIAIRSER